MPSKKRLISVAAFVAGIFVVIWATDYYIQHGSGFRDAIEVRNQLGSER